ncbi:M23 family metallopeptidase [Micromonospora sp. DT81.3]|uniref:M23 family metallopeptidase n=1 Tax=Micromonospora sp. DT81.3 TaxID=3416523 RepID=UPI003CFA80ED
MGAPVAAAAALGNTRTGRRILTGATVTVLLLVAFATAPLIAIPFAVAGTAASSAVTSADAASPAANGQWAYPLAGGYFKGRGFGYNPVSGCSYCSTDHKGYDMAQGCGATVYAAGPGTVLTAGTYQGYGNTVRIDHGDRLITLYAHMQQASLRVIVGQKVVAGTPLGTEGNTGKSFGCHLHYEVQRSGTSVDPQPFMATLGLPLK